jgi:hypothetical protein
VRTDITAIAVPANDITVSYSGDNSVYRLVGASTFSGYFTSGVNVLNGEQHFEVVDQTGGVVAQMSLAVRFVRNADGTVVADYNRNQSTCQR